jgi:hypothetical protein
MHPHVPRRLTGVWRELAAGADESPAAFTPAMIAELPEPARRWLTHAIEPGTPLAEAVTLTMEGEIKIGSWRRFTATQVLAPPRGFIWAARTRVAGLPVTGFDRYSDGAGEMRWRLAGLVPVQSGTGPDITRSAAGRLAAEGTVLLPTAFRHAAWAADPASDGAIATWRIGEHTEQVRLQLGGDGRLRRLTMQRWGAPDGQPAGRHLFAVDVEAEATFAGVTIPALLRAGWGDAEFFRAQITAAAAPAAVSRPR